MPLISEVNFRGRKSYEILRYYSQKYGSNKYYSSVLPEEIRLASCPVTSY